MRLAVERLPARGDNDVAHVHLDDFVLLVEGDGVGRAELLAGPALLPLEPDAGFGVDHRDPRHGLRERHVDRLAVAHAGLEFRIQHLARALFHADAAARAHVVIDVPGLLADLDFEVAHRAADFFQLRVRQQRDVLVLAGLRHLGRQDARRAVQRGERLVELGHVAADRRLAFHQVHGVAGVGQFQRGLQARRCRRR